MRCSLLLSNCSANAWLISGCAISLRFASRSACLRDLAWRLCVSLLRRFLLEYAACETSTASAKVPVSSQVLGSGCAGSRHRKLQTSCQICVSRAPPHTDELQFSSCVSPTKTKAISYTKRVPAIRPSFLPLVNQASPHAPTERYGTMMTCYDYLSWIVFLSHSGGVRVSECGSEQKPHLIGTEMQLCLCLHRAMSCRCRQTSVIFHTLLLTLIATLLVLPRFAHEFCI